MFSSLDVRANVNLDLIQCQDNQITELDFSNNPLLREISCGENNLIHLSIKNGNTMGLSAFFTTNNPNLVCIEIDNEGYTPSCSIMSAPSWCKDPIANYSESCP